MTPKNTFKFCHFVVATLQELSIHMNSSVVAMVQMGFTLMMVIMVDRFDDGNIKSDRTKLIFGENDGKSRWRW